MTDIQQHHNLELSNQYYQQGTLEKDLGFQVATRDYTELINAFDFRTFFSRFDSPMELLDIGCGTGKFPSMLASRLSPTLQGHYDYIDPSEHSLEELRKSLTTPFTPRTALRKTVETLEQSAGPAQGYQVIWCVQSLYCLQHHALEAVMKTLKALLNVRNGVALIYLASSQAWYHRLYNVYNQEVYPNLRQPYITAENVLTILDRLHISYEVNKLHFPHTIPCSDQEILKKYLNQSVFDPDAWERSQSSRPIQALLDSYCNEESYQFPQQVWLIGFTRDGERTGDWRHDFKLSSHMK